MDQITAGKVIIMVDLLFYFGYNCYFFSNPNLEGEVNAASFFTFWIIVGIALYLNPLFKMYTDKVKDGEKSEKDN